MLAFSTLPGLIAYFDAHRTGHEDRLDNVLAGETINRTFEVGFEREVILARGYQPLDLDQAMIHCRRRLHDG
ncbi:MAG: hypothetical protein L0219_13045, partial [Phycisphaerales bacterium]|nr:hypothetical protein [Phycisphaerales bacterium]